MALPKAALVQFQGTSEKRENIDNATRLIRQAARQGANIICLPELFSTAYFCYVHEPAFRALAEPIPGPTTDEMGALAREYGVVIVAPIYEQAPGGEQYNTAAILGTDGELMGIYRKATIPHVDTPTLIGKEKFYFTPGDNGFPVWETPFGVRIGVLICYDRHFPEHARLLALNGADLVLVPTATSGMSDYLWKIELQAHAIANFYYVGAVNRVGPDIGGSPTTEYYGTSFFTNPRGEILVEASSSHEEVICAEIDLEQVREIRDAWGFLRERRPELYGPLAGIPPS